ncbi:EF-hand domain-containing protein [Solimonas soli]|uniref:EF-hand domain-containing protein n=1 Tax=Solimonas soli TaxID=413479 RepID=UPI0004ACEABD|nr:EF-hand domain-containing protein [Solimonas soli]
MALVDAARALAHGDPLPFWLFSALLALASAGAFVLGFRRLRRARLIEDTPTSRIRSAAQGHVELNGFARLLPGPEIFSPLSRARCVWWRYKVEQLRHYYDGDRRRSEWQVIEEAVSDELFLLADADGECIVDPHGVQAYPSLARRWRGRGPRPAQVPPRTPWFSAGEYRYSEQLIHIGDPLYAYGWFRTQSAVQSYDEATDVRELLREWKSDRRELLRRFDTNRDGQIDVAEWDAARRAAQAQVRAEHVEQSLNPDLHVLGRPPHGGEFIVSTLSEAGLARHLRRQAWALLAAALAGGMAFSWLVSLRGA